MGLDAIAFIAGLIIGAAIGALCTHYYERRSCIPVPKSGGGPGEER